MATKKKDVLVIDRKRWMRGRGSDDSYLYNTENRQMCCLGFYLRHCGVSLDGVRDQRSPADVLEHSKTKRVPAWLAAANDDDGEMNTDTCFMLMTFNDDKHAAEKDRENAIKAIFRKHNVTVKFVN